MKRIGVIAIIVNERERAADVNGILGQYASLILGRMGLPRINNNGEEINAISLIIEGTNDEIGALTGKIGNLRGVQIKSALMNLT